MIKIAERQYNVQPGETITVDAQAKGTTHLVNYDVDSGARKGRLSEGQPLNFQGRLLTLLFTFSNDSGGNYVVTLRGDKGGSPDTDNIDQGSFGIPTTTAEYRFQL